MVEEQACRLLDLCDFGGVSYCMGCGLSATDHPGHTEGPQPRQPAAQHQYVPLTQIEEPEIRLIELLPGLPDDELRCHIVHATLGEQTRPFRALSYSWATEDGNAELSEAIYCGTAHRLLPISKNCANALRRIRDEKSMLLVWVDMICINQRDFGERSVQVGFMSQIYSSALQVYVYLGEADVTSSWLFNMTDPDRQIGDFRNLGAFCARRWFHRVWVIQEVAMARSILVVCGSDRLEWDHFCATLSKCVALSKSVHTPPPLDIGNFYYLQGQSLLDLLVSTRPCAATDMRDKVFALLALVSQMDRIPLEPDYSKSPNWVFVQVAAWFTHHHGDLRVLRHAYQMVDLATSQPEQDYIPSWVPQWGKASRQIPLLLAPGLHVSNAPLHRPQLTTISGPCRNPSRGLVDYPMNLGIKTVAQRLAKVWVPTYGKGSIGHFCQGDQHVKRSSVNKNSCQHLDVDFLSPKPPWRQRVHLSSQDFWSALIERGRGSFAHLTLTERRRFALRRIPLSFCHAHNAAVPPVTKTPDAIELKPLFCVACKKHLPLRVNSQYTDFDTSTLHAFITKLHNHQNITMSETENPKNPLGSQESTTGGRVLYGNPVRHHSWKGFATEHSLGFGPRELKTRDEVWRLGGEAQLYILRFRKGRYRLVGPCYVYNAVEERGCCEMGRGRAWEEIVIW